MDMNNQNQKDVEKNNSEKVRINKYLANLGVASRRKIDKLIEDRRIVVNGEIAESGMKVSKQDTIEVNGKAVTSGNAENKEYYILNKPKNIISAASDDRGRQTVVDLVKTKARIYPVGRLDLNTTGLVLLTNDGELFNRLMHPKSKIYKTYIVTVKGDVSKKDMEKLKNGIELEDGKTLPAVIELIAASGVANGATNGITNGSVSNTSSGTNSKKDPRKTKKLPKTTFKIGIREGKNRQIRRMCDAIGHPVIDLKRIGIADLNIKDLSIGKSRRLTEEEINYLYSL